MSPSGVLCANDREPPVLGSAAAPVPVPVLTLELLLALVAAAEEEEEEEEEEEGAVAGTANDSCTQNTMNIIECDRT